MAKDASMGAQICCTACKVEFPATPEHFSKHPRGKYGLRSQCKGCRARVVAAYKASPNAIEKAAAWTAKQAHSGATAARTAAWRRANPESGRISRQKWRAANVDRCREYNQRWRDENRDKARAKQQRADLKASTKPENVLKRRMKARIRAMVTCKAGVPTEELVGFTMAALRAHIERQFQPGMTWDLLMKGEIHIDHIVPVRAFRIQTVRDPDFKACWALSNLQPLWALDNQKKGSCRINLL